MFMRPMIARPLFAPLKNALIYAAAFAIAAVPSIALSETTVPDFEATALTGQKMKKENLIGQPTILIVNPSEEAGDKSKAWAEQIRSRFGTDVRQRTIIAADAPFFVTDYVAMGRARKKVDQQYWPRTWLLLNTNFEESLGIPSKNQDPHILVLDSTGAVVSKVDGELSDVKMAELTKAWNAVAKQNAPPRAPASQSGR